MPLGVPLYDTVWGYTGSRLYKLSASGLRLSDGVRMGNSQKGTCIISCACADICVKRWWVSIKKKIKLKYMYDINKHL